MEVIKILAINLGSTSTKVAYYENDVCVLKENISHPVDEIKKCKELIDQYDIRKSAILDFMNKYGIKLDDLDSVTTRGGQTEPIIGGTYRINEAMVAQAMSGDYGRHPCSLGSKLAFDMCAESDHAIPLTTDVPTTDEFEPLARYSGLKEIPRISSFQALNHKAMARYYAESVGKKYEDMNLVVVMLGGGISVAAHKHGRMIDGPNALTGDGPFSNNRCCTVPVGALVDLCYSGKYTQAEMQHHINGEAGLMSYLGKVDVKEIEEDIANGDKYAEEVLEAMCYQTAKDIGAYATVLKGDVDAILLVGGMANSKFITEHVTERVKFIAPVVVLPGEREMESLCINSYKAIKGEIPTLEFVPKEGN